MNSASSTTIRDHDFNIIRVRCYQVGSSEAYEDE